MKTLEELLQEYFGCEKPFIGSPDCENEEECVIADISVYEGKDQDDKARYSSWKTKFVGEAYEDALKLNDKDKIVIRSGLVDNFYNKETKKLYVTVTIFKFEKVTREVPEENEE